ncbi:MAG: hypothetical protein ACLSTO_03820 [Bilophila wadsworthia]
MAQTICGKAGADDDLTDTLNRTITFLRSARSIEDVRRPIAVMLLLKLWWRTGRALGSR